MNRQYTPRRASKRWLQNAPAHVLDLFYFKDSRTWEALYTGHLLHTYPDLEGPRTFANTYITGREMSEYPPHPQGVGISFELRAHEAAALRYRNGHRRVAWESLPQGVKACIIRDGQP